MSKQEDFPYNGFLSGIEITQIGRAAPEVSGPLGRLGNWLRPDRTEYVIGFYATTFASDADSRHSYEYFPSGEQRQDMYEAARTIADYCHDESIAAAVYLDRSARPVRVGVREYEKLAYADDPPTPAYFINPLLFREAAYSRTFDEFEWALDVSKYALEDRLTAVNSKLLTNKDKPILLIDACLHTGETLFYTKWALNEAGVNDVRTLVVSDDGLETTMIEPDVVTDEKIGLCKPFGFDFGVAASKDDIFRPTAQSMEGRRFSIEMRTEVRRIIREQHAASR